MDQVKRRRDQPRFAALYVSNHVPFQTDVSDLPVPRAEGAFISWRRLSTHVLDLLHGLLGIVLTEGAHASGDGRLDDVQGLRLADNHEPYSLRRPSRPPSGLRDPF